MTEPVKFAATSRSLMKETVLKAVDDLVREHPWSSVSMASVAKAAGVSRQTLYNVFGDRDELTSEYVVWAADDLLDDIERVVSAHRDDMSTALREGFKLFLSIAPEHPLIRALLASTGSEDLHALLSTPAGQPLLVAATVRLTAILEANWPDERHDDVALIAELLVRLAISNITHPMGTPDEAAARIVRVLSPFLAEFSVEPGAKASFADL